MIAFLALYVALPPSRFEAEVLGMGGSVGGGGSSNNILSEKTDHRIYTCPTPTQKDTGRSKQKT